MSQYQTTPLKAAPVLLTAGLPAYLLGSYSDRTSPTTGFVLSNSAVTTTGTLTFQIVSGPVPLVGELITVVGAARSTNFNVTNGTILTVSAVADAAGLQTGVVTVTYAITSTSLGTASDGGQVTVVRVETGETLVSGASVPAAVSFNPASPQNGRTLTAVVSFPSLPTTITSVDLQGADFDRDAEYVTLVPTSGGDGGTPNHLAHVTGGTLSGGSASYGDDVCNYRFYRFNVVGASGGTLPTVVAKLVD